MVGTAEDMPGGGWFDAEAPVADDEVRGADFRSPQAAISAPAAVVRPGRDSEPVVSSGEEGFPRGDPSDGSDSDENATIEGDFFFSKLERF